MAAATAVVAAAMVLGLAFAGSPSVLAPGIRIAGVSVGGLTPLQATTMLDARTARLASVPVVFVAGAQRFAIRPEQLGVRPDWKVAVAEAVDKGSGIGVLRDEGYLKEAGARIVSLTRQGLLRVDTLLPRFFLPEHVGIRYT